MKHTIESLGHRWESTEIMIASSGSANGVSRKRLIIRVKYNGKGEEMLRFIVLDHGKETVFDTADEAVDEYNAAP